jgi:ABC-type multidrug transport system ATPase subunit
LIKPEILILDEPTANVDRRNIQTIENLLKKINVEHGITIIFTTHDLSQAYRMTKNVISLLDGKVISGGSENIIYGIFRQENGQKFINIAPNINIKVNNFNQDNVGIYISPNNIKVSLIPDYNDNRNCLKGHVTSVTMLNGNVRLIIDTGIELISLISKEAFQEIASAVFTKDIYVIIDISDVHVF